MTSEVLIIDDDTRLFELVAKYLSQNGVSAQHAVDGSAGLRRLAAASFDAVFLDIMMPGLDGLEVLRRIREKSTIPVIMLTAKGDETDRVVGLELGADDYLTKPFSARELLARLRAVLRRGSLQVSGERLKVGDIQLDLSNRSVSVQGIAIELTGLEFDLLTALMRRAGRVVPRGSLLSLAGRADVTVNERTVDVHISHLRRKLSLGNRSTRLIQTVRGVGYVLNNHSS
jgi:DNA-binding response OmpR family regulator